MFKHILLPTDDTELSRIAVNAGIEFARETGARVTGFTVSQEYIPVLATEGYGYLDPASIEIFEQAAKRRTEESLDFIRKKTAELAVPCDAYAVNDLHIHEAIIRAAQEYGCDLIWMASHGRRGLAGVLLGSETSKVLALSKIPVLVYR